MKHSTGLALGILLSGLATARGGGGQVDGEPFFEARVRPLLHERCIECHGGEEPKAGLRLEDPGGIRAGTELGPVVAPGDLDASRLWRAVSYADPDLRMPPRGKLAENELATLREWIEAGAPMPAGEAAATPKPVGEAASAADHWSFQPIADPDPPAVRDAVWPRADLDRFVLARLESEDLTPAPEVDRRTWLRRVSYGLVGLPPTVDELAAFLTDTSPEAYERVVDRLLASPHFGETWGRHWLDLVRYAETKGHEFDFPIPNAWRYRDWVVRAFDADVPYDRFVVEQVAGDLVAEPRPHPTEGWDESILGTGWWWLGEEMHSPVDIRADETDRIADQVDTFSKAFLGLTVACARCHDHKFDAISQRDYYALSGFALSGHYRQVRFESRERNAAVARELEELRAAHREARRAATFERFAGWTDELPALLHAARTAIVTRPEPSTGPIPADLDLLVEDFEGDDWNGWTASGEALGMRPLRRAELAGYQGDVGARGRGLVSTHNGWRDGELVHTDELTGTLESPPIRVERDHLHFLIGGGNHADGTYVELLQGGERVAHVVGPANNRMQPAHFDVSAWRGRDVVLRVVDAHAEGWGNIALDHVVLSDRADAGALEVDARPAALAARHAHLARAAALHGVEVGDLEKTVEVLRGAALETPGHPLALWARVVDGERRGLPASAALALARLETGPGDALGLPDDARVRADFGDANARVGTGFVVRPAGALDPQGRLLPLAAAVADPVWDDLANAPGTEGEPGKLSWDRDERTLATPSFRLEGGRLHYLVHGAGRVYAAVDSHKLLAGPLHQTLARDVDGGEGFRWVTHDLSRYAGHLVRLEFSARGRPADFAVAQVVEAERAPGAEAIGGWNAGLETTGATEIPGLLAAALGRTLRAAELDEAAPAELLALDRLSPLVGGALDPGEEYRAALADVLARRVRTSATAPAMLDGSGVDELYLVRGDAGAATEPVPRAFLAALGGEPLGGEHGSGRLALARELVDPENPLVSRVWVNRVWHHVFGRGIVATVDDLGHMGEPPTHPALLDHLARRFTGELEWSTKALVRELVLSSTYRQSSEPDERAAEADPTNRLWHHVPVRRLPAEALRDALLAVSGELDREVGGPSVPVHLTPFMEGRGRPGSSGPLDGNRRRSLYLSVRRNFLVPMLAVFDFPVPSSPRGRRTVSNVPAQALALMNDPFVVDRARAWAERTLAARAGADDGTLVDRMFLDALGRGPTAAEETGVLALLDAQRDVLADETAAWTDVAHVLFNLKEFRFLR